MGRIWVLDTETKGTGAHMVPLETPARSGEPLFVPPKRKPREPEPTKRPPLTFRIVDVTTRETLADRVGAREALGILNGVRSIVDVHAFLWEPTAERWRLLTLEELRTLWDRQQRGSQAATA